jgi:hypothetical protein
MLYAYQELAAGNQPEAISWHGVHPTCGDSLADILAQKRYAVYKFIAHLMPLVSAMNTLHISCLECQQWMHLHISCLGVSRDMQCAMSDCAPTKVNNSLLSVEAQLGVAAEHWNRLRGVTIPVGMIWLDAHAWSCVCANLVSCPSIGELVCLSHGRSALSNW